MSDYLYLADELDEHAENNLSCFGDSIMRFGAVAIRKQAARIADLEAEVARMLVVQSSLDQEIVDLETMLSAAKASDCDER